MPESNSYAKILVYVLLEEDKLESNLITYFGNILEFHLNLILLYHSQQILESCLLSL